MSDRFAVLALDATNGNKIWNYTAGNNQFEYPVTVADEIVYTQTRGSIVGFNSGSGALVWNYTNVDLWPTSEVVIVNGIIYLGYSDGQIYAIKAPGAVITGIELQGQNTGLLIAIVVTFALILTGLIVLNRSKSKRTLTIG